MTLATFHHEAMATYFEITVADHEKDYASKAAVAAWGEVDRLESELSRYIESSDISRANRLACNDTILIGHDALECLKLAAAVAGATAGAFDVAYGSVRSPGKTAERPPFTIDPASHSLTSRAKHLRLDLGAIGKGYALDCMASVLSDWGITSASLNSGGSTVLALAPPSGEKGWPAALGEGESHRILPLAHAALSGSGTAVKGAHLIDPRTATAAKRSQRAWALAPTAAIADALSTAFFVAEPNEIAAICAVEAHIGCALAGPNGTVELFGALRNHAEYR
jgi:thiamine biosynthesis lipoprotein